MGGGRPSSACARKALRAGEKRVIGLQSGSHPATQGGRGRGKGNAELGADQRGEPLLHRLRGDFWSQLIAV